MTARAADVYVGRLVPNSHDANWFETAWAEREEEIYARDFGSLGSGIYPLDHDVFNRLGRMEIDSRWLTIGAFESPSTDRRGNWVYVTSGLSNAWEATVPDASGWSGMGMEFLIQCNSQSSWALSLARNLAAYQLLLAVGHYGERDPLDFWDRTAIGSSIDSGSSLLRALLFVPAPHFSGPRQITSGRFEYLQAIGLTVEEHALGREQGYESLHTQLVAKGASPVMDRTRASIV